MEQETFVHGTAEIHEDAVVGHGTTIWNWTKVREGARTGCGCDDYGALTGHHQGRRMSPARMRDRW